MHIEFQAVSPENVSIIRDLALQVWPQTFSSILSAEQIQYMLDWMYSERQLANEIAHEGIHYDLILVDGAPAGYIGYGPGSEPGDLKLHKLYVLPDVQRHGLGGAAFNRLKQYAAAQACRFIILQVNRHNEQAIRAYRKYGFRTRKEAVTDIGNGFVMDDYILECPIT